jgi:hypothetical protein
VKGIVEFLFPPFNIRDYLIAQFLPDIIFIKGFYNEKADIDWQEEKNKNQ